MTQADSVLSTPPTNTSVDPTRRRFITIVAAGAAAIATTSPAMAGVAEPDPNYAAFDAFRRAHALFFAEFDGDIPDEIGDQYGDACSVMRRTRPTTPAGLAVLTTWAREQADWLCANSSVLHSEDYCALAASIDDAARGMSGLEPWSPPPAMPLARVLPHPDAELVVAIERYYEVSREYDIRLRAFDKVELIKPRPRGYVSKERAYLRSMKHYGRAEREVAAIRANTLEGLIAKATAANNEFCPSERIQLSVAEDVLGMQPGRGKAVV